MPVFQSAKATQVTAENAKAGEYAGVMPALLLMLMEA
jgi:hypothetical protein